MAGDLMDGGRPRCVAISKQSGVRCKRRPSPGQRVCVMHGGASPQARAAAERRKAEAEATALLEQVWNPGAPPVTNVVDALHSMAGRLEHSVNVLGARLASEPLDSPNGVAWMRAIREQRQLLADIARLGIAEKHAELEAERAALVTTAFRAALAVLDLLPVDRDLAVRKFLEVLRVNTDADGTIVRGEVEPPASEDGS